MGDPLFWLGLSLLLVAVSLTAVLVVAIPAMRELSRAARSAEKLFDTLGRELPPTLEAIRLTGLEITEMTDDMSEGVQQVNRVVKQVDDGLSSARQQAKTLHNGTQSLLTGVRAAWEAWSKESRTPPPRRPHPAVPPPNPSHRPQASFPSPQPVEPAPVTSEQPAKPGHIVPNPKPELAIEHSELSEKLNPPPRPEP